MQNEIEKNMQNAIQHKIKKGIKFIFIGLAIVAFVFVFSFIVMKLWNNVLAEVVNVKQVSFWQAMGILVLSKILFGGFGPGGKRGGPPAFARRRMEEKMKNLSPEEREIFKARMQNRCGWGETRTETQPEPQA